MLADYEAGGSTESVANKHNVCREYVRKKVHQYGIVRRVGRPGGLIKEQIPLVLDTYRKGASLEMVGKQFGVTHETIRSTLKLWEVRIRNQREALEALKVRNKLRRG